MRIQWTVLAVVLAMSVVACSTQQYGQCDAPNEELEVMFKPKNKMHPFSHSFCIVCNKNLAPSEYGAWAIEMGAPQGPSDANAVHPCLYVYGGGQPDTLEGCLATVCGGEATYNDMVGKGNGNFNLDPLLNGTASAVSESNLAVDEGGLSLDALQTPPAMRMEQAPRLIDSPAMR